MTNSTLSAVLHDLRCLVGPRDDGRQDDRQLLERFLTQREEAAFALLVRRHGRMVLSACRRVLSDEADVEDAFQATFLVLLRRASSMPWRTSIGAWLFGVAHRIAVRARANALRRQRREAEASRVRPELQPPPDLSWREAIDILHEELDRLPDKYRLPLLLCYFDGKTREEAAAFLACSAGAVKGRLERGREVLRSRLLRRGVALLGSLLAAATLATPPALAVPAGLVSTTIKAVLATAAGEGLTGVVSASVAELVQSAITALMVSKAKMATLLLVSVSLLAGAGAWTCRTLATPQPAQTPAEAPAPLARSAQTQKPDAPRQEKGESVTVQGRVLDPDGKPVKGARVYASVTVLLDSQTPEDKLMDSIATAEDGRFSFTFARSRLMEPETKFPLQNIRIVAAAKGRGPDWLEVPLPLTPTLSPNRGRGQGEGVTLRLVEDDVPIQGRILSLEGKPLTVIKVYVRVIRAFPKDGLSRALDARRQTIQVSDLTEVRTLWSWHHIPIPSLMATTGADGRFRLEGLGRERIVTITLEGPGIEYAWIDEMTRRADLVRDKYNNAVYGATFDFLVRPSRLIRGTVREKGSGKPLAGIGVHEIGFTGRISHEVWTDEQGRYELRGCAKSARYGLSARASHGEPYLLSSIGVKDTVGLGPLTADLQMERGIPCEGKVLDAETGQAVPGEIGYYPLYPNANVTRDIGLGNALRDSRLAGYAAFSQSAIQTDGSFRCAVLPGIGCLAFRARESETNRYVLACIDPSTSTVKVRGDTMVLHGMNGEGMLFGLFQEQFQAIRLIEPAKDTKKVSEIIRVAVARQISGTVLDADGKPLTDVRVRGLKRWEWRTLATEKFTVRGVHPLRPRQLYFVHQAKHLIGTVEVKGTETKPLTIRLQRWAAVRGRLLDADGLPLRNARLHGSGLLPEEDRTDNEGRFRLEGLVPGLRYDLTYSKDKPSLSGTLLKGFVGKPGEVRDLGDVRGQPFRQG